MLWTILHVCMCKLGGEGLNKMVQASSFGAIKDNITYMFTKNVTFKESHIVTVD